MKTLAYFAIRSHINALLVIVSFAIISIMTPIFSLLSLLSGAVIALYGLRKGIKEGLQLSAIAFAITLLLTSLLLKMPIIAFFILGIFWLPVLLPAWILRYNQDLAKALSIALVPVFLGMGLFFIFWSGEDPARFFQPFIQQIMNELKINGLVFTQDQMTVVNSLPQMLLSVLLLSFYLQTIFALIIGRWWQAVLFNAGGFQKEFHQLKMPVALVNLSFIIWALALLSDSPYLLACSLLLIVPYVLQGIAIIHAFVKGKKLAPLFLLITYFMLFTQVAILIAFFGYLDHWLQFRARYLNKI